MIDLHSHVLPGLDDGAETLAESLAICEAAAADGVRTLAATPHVRDDYPTTPEQMETALAEVRAAVGDTLTLVAGGELDLAMLDRPDVGRFALAGGRYLLVETPYTGWPLDIAEKLFRLRLAGFTPVLAHPERNRDVQSRPELLDPLVAAGTLVQLTAASVDGRIGTRSRDGAFALIERGAAHLIASDAHNPEVREIGLSAARDAVGGLAQWMTEDVPRAIVEGTQLPPRPQEARARRRWFRR